VAGRGIYRENFFRSSFKSETRPDTASVAIIELPFIPLVSPEMRMASLDIHQHGQYLIFDSNRRLSVASGGETLLHFSIRHLDMNTSTLLADIHFHILGSRDIPHYNASQTLDRQGIQHLPLFRTSGPSSGQPKSTPQAYSNGSNSCSCKMMTEKS
jgi:hypothetical protein